MTTAQINKLIHTVLHSEAYPLDSAGNHIAVTTKQYEAYYGYGNLIVLTLKQPPYLTFINKGWNNGSTLAKYRNQFLNETTKETLAKLQSGTYISMEIDNGKL